MQRAPPNRLKQADELIRSRPFRSWEDVAKVDGLSLGMTGREVPFAIFVGGLVLIFANQLEVRRVYDADAIEAGSLT
jgi:hypothetical protein